MREYNFKASDNNGEILMGMSFPFSFMGIAGLILIIRLYLFPKIKFLDIYRIIEEVMNSHQILSLNTDNALNIIKEVDRETRKKVREQWER